MSSYDFTGLSPSDFESLCHDLLERSLNVQLQEFVTGRDKGIDLRHAPLNGKDWIVQCKHFARSGYAKLRSHLSKIELPKIKKLNPGRYILATSVGLSPSNVDDLFQILQPYCRSKHDIIGQNDLNGLLRANPTIEQTHFKLWLTSQAVLARVLHNDVFVQSILTEDGIKQRLGLYVYTDSFEKARRKLESERVCILSGIPGVGKTTLAEMLIVEYLMNDWQVISMHQNVTEGQKLFCPDPTVKQVLYYDDFLGQISTGEKLGKNEDRALFQLINAVSRTANKRFILTTREYILAQAKAEHEYLARSDIDLHRFVVSCDDYSEGDKARILANHLYFARVPQDHIAALVGKRTYRQIVSHRNYSPRIIEWMTHVTEVNSCKPEEYPSIFISRLNNPSDLWAHAFQYQITEASRHLLLVLASCGDGIVAGDLTEAFEAFYLERGRRFGFAASPSHLRQALDELEGNFIRIEGNATHPVVLCHNPSILDFLQRWLAQHSDDACDILRHCVFFEQVERLFNVFHFDTTYDSNGQSTEVYGGLAASAIERTLLARSIRHFKTGNKWHRTPANVWERLKTCCQIGNKVECKHLRKAIEEHIETQLADVQRYWGELYTILPLLEAVENCKWFDVSMVEQWNDRVWDALVLQNAPIDEPLCGLEAAADWYVRQRVRFPPEQANQIENRLSDAVGEEVRNNSDRNNAERLNSDMETVEGIAQVLGRDFSSEIQWLAEALDNCEQRDEEDDESWREHPSDSSSSSIDSLFDALLE